MLSCLLLVFLLQRSSDLHLPDLLCSWLTSQMPSFFLITSAETSELVALKRKKTPIRSIESATGTSKPVGHHTVQHHRLSNKDYTDHRSAGKQSHVWGSVLPKCNWRSLTAHTILRWNLHWCKCFLKLYIIHNINEHRTHWCFSCLSCSSQPVIWSRYWNLFTFNYNHSIVMLYRFPGSFKSPVSSDWGRIFCFTFFF